MAVVSLSAISMPQDDWPRCGLLFSLIQEKVRYIHILCHSDTLSLDTLCVCLCVDNSLGIKEVQIIQWFVEPGARVEQFDKIVEVQTDKASNEVWDALLHVQMQGREGQKS